MTARIAGFISRTDAGLRLPRSVSRNITPARGGVAAHYGGSGGPPSSHPACLRTWRSWQAYHMDVHGWADIAYSFGYCDHGHVMAGRGFGTRTAANGTNAGNDAFYAACWIGGGAAAPTPAAVDALHWIVSEARTSGGAGLDVRPHRWFKSTSCPGGPLAAVAAALHQQPVPVQPTPPEEDEMPTADEVADAVQARFDTLLRAERGVHLGRAMVRIHDNSNASAANTNRLLGLQAQITGLVGAVAALTKDEPFDEAKLLAGVRAAAEEGVRSAVADGINLDVIASQKP